MGEKGWGSILVQYSQKEKSREGGGKKGVADLERGDATLRITVGMKLETSRKDVMSRFANGSGEGRGRP